ncbi:PQQ-dependent sugar dehydrogenase [Candidatus Kaiserbacteria bacterium]|nr:PQQ-dependent sugar dehydrogenase [Candidatus Kaiserbacteria bacterium]
MRYAGWGLLFLLVIGLGLWSTWGAVKGILPFIRPAPQLPEGEPLPFSLEEGFVARLYTNDVPGARVLLRDPRGVLLASLTDNGSVVALPDADANGVADTVVQIISGLRKPHGLAFRCAPDCAFYIAEEHAVREYAYDPETRQATYVRTLAALPFGRGHTTRSLLAHPNGKDLLVAIGSSCNVCNERDPRRAAILAIDLESGAVRPFATGLRNTVFMAARRGEVWGTDMGRDFLGDDLPPDEINILRERAWYGWPWFYGQNVEDFAFNPNARPSFAQESVPSHIDIPAHSAPLGLAFIPAEGWPAEFQGDLLVAYHGSWNRSVPTGYKVVRMKLTPDGQHTSTTDFITGFLKEGEAIGRPAGILAEPGGIVYVSDDHAGAIYRITRE